MAGLAQLQYTQVVGPVWTEPVAARLAWLPQGQQPARGHPPRRLGSYARPEFEALYRPEGLQWFTPDTYAGRSQARAGRDWTAYQEPPSAPVFDPQGLEWLPQGQGWRARVASRRLGDFQQPFTAAIYRPEGLEWQAADRYAGRALPRRLRDWTVLPELVTSPAFEPQTLSWQPRGSWPQRRPETRRGEFVRPIFEALYQPEGLEWRDTATHAGRVRPRAALDWTVLQRPIVAAFDPGLLDWLPRDARPHRTLERRVVGAFAQPAFEALYRAEGMEWALSGLQPARERPRILSGYWTIDPVTPAPVLISARVVFVARTEAARFAADSDADRFIVNSDPTRFKVLH